MRVLAMGEDLVVLLDGGERPHAGAVGLSGGGVTTSCVILPHKEEPLARGIAERMSEVTGNHVAVVCGIHLSAITVDEIKEVFTLADEMVDAWIEEYRGKQEYEQK